MTGKRRGKQQVNLKKNMEVMKKKPPNKDSINKRINIKTRLKGKFTQKESWSEMKKPTKPRRTTLTVCKHLV